MILRIDLERALVETEDGDGVRTYELDSPEAFALVSEAWLRAGWDAKYVYGFTWFGRPVIQLPEDLVRVQEAIYRVRPTVILETGIAHGGSLVFYASLCKAMGRGRVVGIDIEIRPHNRRALEEHPLFDLITLYEGDSTDPELVARIQEPFATGRDGLRGPGQQAHEGPRAARARAVCPARLRRVVHRRRRRT